MLSEPPISDCSILADTDLAAMLEALAAIAHRADGTSSQYRELIIRPNDGRHQPTELNLD